MPYQRLYNCVFGFPEVWPDSYPSKDFVGGVGGSGKSLERWVLSE